MCTSLALNVSLPIRSNCCYEIVEALFGDDRSCRTFESHMLRIGVDALKRAGLGNPIIGLTVTETKVIPLSEAMALGGDLYVRMSGILRAAD
jgi:hypothetical protein